MDFSESVELGGFGPIPWSEPMRRFLLMSQALQEQSVGYIDPQMIIGPSLRPHLAGYSGTLRPEEEIHDD